MKKNITVRILVILAIIAICLVSFLGIYINSNTNMVPDYLLSMNLKGSRVVQLGVNTSTKEVVYDSQGNVSEDGKNDDGTLKEGYKKEDVKINKDEDLTNVNYQRSKNIVEKRLEKMGIKEYAIRLNNDNGEIIMEIPENINTDEVISNLAYVGKFEIIDSQTKQVLLSNSDLKEAKAVYGSANEGGTKVYLSIEFNKEGTKKLADITKTYTSSKNDAGEEVTKKVKIQLDDNQLLETYFDEEISTGILQLSIGNATTSSTELSSYLKQAANVASLIDNSKMPVEYKLNDNTYISAQISENVLKLVIMIISIIFILLCIYLCIKYRLNGLLASISLIGFIATILLVVRYVNVIISFESIMSMIIIVIANYMFINYVLKKAYKSDLSINEIFSKGFVRYLSILFPLLIIAVVFTFIDWIAISSIGMIIFWGLVIMCIYNYLLLKPAINKKND